MAREIDVTGMPYSTRLSAGQTSYSGDRVQKTHLMGTLNHGLLGTNIKFANQVMNAEMDYANTSRETLDMVADKLGEEYKDKWFTGKEICKVRGISVYYNKRKHNFSTTELRNKVKWRREQEKKGT